MYQYRIKEIVKVVDGDTVDVIIDLGFNTFIKSRVRLYGINTPETRLQKSIASVEDRHEEKRKGLVAKEKVKEILYSAKSIKLDSKGLGKYGRALGVITIDDKEESLNDFLLNNGYAVKM
tara:strand:+ start:4041 stop:4400 length:360 start_codon:yes stop_codon:yes gene_type:complete